MKANFRQSTLPNNCFLSLILKIHHIITKIRGRADECVNKNKKRTLWKKRKQCKWTYVTDAVTSGRFNSSFFHVYGVKFLFKIEILSPGHTGNTRFMESEAV